MFYLSFIPLLAAVVACIGLSRVLPTRILGFVAATASAMAALILLIGQSQPAMLGSVAPTLTLVPYGIIQYAPTDPLSAVSIPLALLLTAGGALALAMLSLALSTTVRGFGTLFAWALLALAAALLGLFSHGLLLPISWTLVVLTGYGAVWSSGAIEQQETIPTGLALGLLSGLLLTAGLLIAESALAVGMQPPAPALLCLLLACLILSGSAPFHGAFDEAVVAPAGLGGLLYGLVLPLLALGTLLRLVTGDIVLLIEAPGIVGAPYTTMALPPMEEVSPWLGSFLLVAAVISMLTCVAGALCEHSLRRLLAWLASWQASLVILAVSMGGIQATLTAPALLINLGLTTLAGTLAVAMMERLIGSDDFTQVVGRDGAPLSWTNLRLSGILWACSAVSALGLPPLWGFWGRSWLLEAMLQQIPWLVPLLLAMSVLALLAYLVPLIRFWFLQNSEQLIPAMRYRSTASLLSRFCGWLSIVPLVVFGVMPHWVGAGWSPIPIPVTTTLHISVVIVAIVALLFGVLLQRSGWAHKPRTDIDMIPVVLAPDALARHMVPLAWPARPVALFDALWTGTILLSKGIRGLLWLFEQRFYLVGIMFGLIVLIFLMAQ